MSSNGWLHNLYMDHACKPTSAFVSDAGRTLRKVGFINRTFVAGEVVRFLNIIII